MAKLDVLAGLCFVVRFLTKGGSYDCQAVTELRISLPKTYVEDVKSSCSNHFQASWTELLSPSTDCVPTPRGMMLKENKLQRRVHSFHAY